MLRNEKGLKIGPTSHRRSRISLSPTGSWELQWDEYVSDAASETTKDAKAMADLSFRDWMVIIGALMILAVLVDAVRRVYQEHRSPVRMRLAKSDGDDNNTQSGRDIDLAWLRELPNGGHRVIEREEGDERGECHQSQAADDAAGISSQNITEAAVDRSTKVPVGRMQQPAVKLEDANASDPEEGITRRAEDLQQIEPEPGFREQTGGFGSTNEPENLDWLDALESEPSRSQPEQAAAVQLPRDIEPEVFMLNVIARDASGFRGEDILHILLACDLRFGDMAFFHRYEQESGRGPIQFSVANMMKPGIFDIDNMADFSTQGLVFFVTLPGPDDMMKAFDYMLETAQAVARNLDGDVLDESRSVLTRQTLEHTRQKIKDLERRLLAQTR
ncbi:MAG: cell division protein ZipA [Parahaliea sp.]